MEQRTKTDSLYWQMVYIVKSMITGHCLHPSVSQICNYARLLIVSCPDYTSHKENGLGNQVEFLGPITGMW